MKWPLLALLVLLTGCGMRIDGQQYRDQQPPLDLVQFFSGDVKGWGIVQNRSGNVVSRFTVDIKGSYRDGVLTLDETFEYGLGDGVKQRVWTIRPAASQQFSGSANDIPGPATGQRMLCTWPIAGIYRWMAVPTRSSLRIGCGHLIARL